MKIRMLGLSGLILALGLAVFWQRQKEEQSISRVSEISGKAVFRCPMHPWITSPQKGRCTICGMDLVLNAEAVEMCDPTAGPTVVKLSSESVEVLDVRTAIASASPLKSSLHLVGSLQIDGGGRYPRSQTSATFSGIVVKVFQQKIGTVMKAGDPIMEISSPELFEARSKCWRVFRDPHRSVHELELARARLTNYGLTEKQIESLETATEVDPNTTIGAPFLGYLTQVYALPLGRLDPGNPLYSYTDLRILSCAFTLQEQDFGLVKNGQLVDITFPALPGKHFRCPISSQDADIDQTTRTRKIRVQISNDDGNLVENLPAEGSLSIETDRVLCVPRSAVLNTGLSTYAFVDLGGGRFERRHVTLGRYGDEAVEVLSGLRLGERVVTNGALLMDDQAELDRESHS